jgi:predicted RNase H-like HicB family nuclease
MLVEDPTHKLIIIIREKYSRGDLMSEYIISINIRKLDEGGYLATSDSIRGLVAQGRTIAETIEIAQDVARKLIESYVEHGDPLPGHMAVSARLIKNVKIPVSVTV